MYHLILRSYTNNINPQCFSKAKSGFLLNCLLHIKNLPDCLSFLLFPYLFSSNALSSLYVSYSSLLFHCILSLGLSFLLPSTIYFIFASFFRVLSPFFLVSSSLNPGTFLSSAYLSTPLNFFLFKMFYLFNPFSFPFLYLNTSQSPSLHLVLPFLPPNTSISRL